MKQTHLLICLSIVGFGFWGCHQSDPPELSYSLVWSDEFDGTSVDESKWEFQLGDGSDYGLFDWGNNERQYYKKENASVSDGILTIESKREFAGDKKYTSVRMRTLGKGDWYQGRFEARIKMDQENGLWHAFWMLPSYPSEPWPKSGEIDIMEQVGNTPNNVLFNIHYETPVGIHDYRGFTLTQPDTFNFAEFHTYAIEWDDFAIKWFLDGEEVFQISKDDPELNGVWPYEADFHIILNLAIGGNLTGDIVNDLTFPSVMQVDYVRVYQLN